MKTDKIKHSVLLLILVLLAGCSSPTEKEIVPKTLFPDLHGWDLKQIAIADTDKNTLEFRRMNCVWVVGNDNKPSDEPRVTALADKLVSLAPQELPALGPDRYGDFKVGEKGFSRKVTLTFKDGSFYTLLIGTPGITKPVYVRIADKNRIFWIDEPLLKQINLDSNSWLAIKET
jgi:hypothetical protein